MENYIHLFIIIPLIGFLVSLLIRPSAEESLSKVAFFTTGTNMLLLLGFTIIWLFRGGSPMNLKDPVIYEDAGYHFFIDFLFDRISATYLLTGSILSFVVVIYSRYYMHKESGFKRFFNTILFFYAGYIITVLAGNFETLFIGWELLGISSFLLISFYRLRYLPVKNAVKVYSIYRIGDIGILLAMWMSHHFWHENVTFYNLSNDALVRQQLADHGGIGIFISLMVLLAALAKSAQLPFSAWLPRAMEGPTPSSAIFYGSLSVHIGAFLLMRTFPFWEHQTSIRWLFAGMGLATAVVTTLIARVQSTIKGQIAYSSASQIGIIFIEIAAGLEVLALIHFVGNAFLRTYQLLISPSAVAYLVREQFYTYRAPETTERHVTAFSRMKEAIYILSVKEWHLDSIIFQLIFKPLKKIRGLLGPLTHTSVFVILTPVYLLGIYLAYTGVAIPVTVKHGLAIAAGGGALIMVAKAYNERTSSRLAWALVVFAHFFVDLAVTLNDHLDLKEATYYLSGIFISGLLGYICLYRVHLSKKGGVGLNRFHGLVEKHRLTAFLFLLACLGVTGFPITTAFLGEDLVLTHIHEKQIPLALLVSLAFIINGIAVIRIYARVFLGHYTRTYQHATSLTM